MKPWTLSLSTFDYTANACMLRGEWELRTVRHQRRRPSMPVKFSKDSTERVSTEAEKTVLEGEGRIEEEKEKEQERHSQAS